MAQAQTLKFSQFLVEIWNGTAYAAPCGLNSRGFNRTAAQNESNVPDCDDPDAPSWLERDTVSLSAAIDGSGVVANEDFDTWDDWFTEQDTKNVRITLGARVWIGPMKCASLQVQGERGQRVNFTASLQSDGKLVKQ